MELNDEAVDLVAGLLNLSKEKVLELAPADDAAAQFAALGAKNLKDARDEGHKKGTKLTAKSVASAFKAEFDIDLTGETPAELAKSLKENLSEFDSDELSEEAVKGSEWYKELQADKTRLEQQKDKAIDKEVKKRLTEERATMQREIKAAKRTGFMTEIEVAAAKWLEAEGAILSDDPEKRGKQIRELAKRVEAFDFEKDEDGEFLFTKDGEPLKNKDGHGMGLGDIFRENDFLFNYKTVQQRRSSELDPRNPGGGGNGGFQHFKGEVPKDEAGMNKLRNEFMYERTITREALKEAEDAYNASKTA